MSNNTKYQSSKVGGILLIVISLVMFASIFVAMGVVAMTVGKDYPFFVLFPGFGLIMPLLPLGFGIFILIRASGGAKVKRQGRKQVCEIFRILRVKNGYNMVIKYFGDSGAEHRLSVPISYSTAIEFKEGMYVECYVLGEDAYLDVSNVREVEKPLD